MNIEDLIDWSRIPPEERPTKIGRMLNCHRKSPSEDYFRRIQRECAIEREKERVKERIKLSKYLK